MHPRERRHRFVGSHSDAPAMNSAQPVYREKGINSTPAPALNGSLPFLPHHHTRRWEELVLIFLASMETRIMTSHFAETASCGHPGPSPRCPPITHRSSRSRYAMAKGDKDLMPSTGSMIPSHTVESKVSKSQAHAQRPSEKRPIHSSLSVTFQSLGEVGKTCLSQGPHDGQALCWSALVGPQKL